MREIKFRAWHSERGIWLYSDEIPMTGEPSRHLELHSNGYCIIMQYTGLKDKNGNEIYEYDILNYKSYNSKVYKIGRVGWSCTNACWIIKSYYSDNPKSDYYSMRFNEIWQYEIIGNIYENPELLETGGQNENRTKCK